MTPPHRHLACSLLVSLLVSACPSGDDGNTTTEAAASTGTTTAGPSSTDQPPATGSSGPGNSSNPDSTSAPGTSTSPSTTAADSSTGAPTIACDDATTEEECAAAGSFDSTCGWFRTRHFVPEEMCELVAQGGLCLTNSQGDETCGIFRDPSCEDTDIVVYVRPSMEADGATETLQLGTSDACTGPDPGEGWELCVPAMMMPGCRCGCS